MKERIEQIIPLEETIRELLTQRGLTLSTAESCTGGLIADRITNVSGSSNYFLGSIVAYSNAVKEQVLNVRRETLLAHGAVSRETALEMAHGVRQLLGSDIALATTGIAGPTGGTPGKPVGLVFIALTTEAFERCEQYLWQGDRLANKAQSAETALDLLYQYLKSL